jgi:purine-nucleoside phosphorylase
MTKAIAPAKVSAAKPSSLQPAPDLARHIITYDSQKPSTYSPFSLPQAQVMESSTLSLIPWPAGQAPTPQPMARKPASASPLPQADYVVVTWTVEEAKALADTLTPGYPSTTAWYDYTHNFTKEFVPLIKKGAPSLESKRLGSYFLTTIAGKRVLCMKSELHFSQDGAKIPVAKLWAQIIAEAQPKLLITTGTAGGIGSAVELGDVVSATAVRFDCQKAFASEPFHNAVYACSTLQHRSIAVAQQLILANTAHLPSAARAPQIFAATDSIVPVPDVVTTDFFAFDDSSNTYGLQGLGGAVEMGDAVLGMVISQMTAGAPNWVAIRNASDPQIDDAGLTVEQAGNKASQIYEKFGYWTTISSAIACWSAILDN